MRLNRIDYKKRKNNKLGKRLYNKKKKNTKETKKPYVILKYIIVLIVIFGGFFFLIFYMETGGIIGPSENNFYGFLLINIKKEKIDILDSFTLFIYNKEKKKVIFTVLPKELKISQNYTLENYYNNRNMYELMRKLEEFFGIKSIKNYVKIHPDIYKTLSDESENIIAYLETDDLNFFPVEFKKKEENLYLIEEENIFDYMFLRNEDYSLNTKIINMEYVILKLLKNRFEIIKYLTKNDVILMSNFEKTAISYLKDISDDIAYNDIYPYKINFDELDDDIIITNVDEKEKYKEFLKISKLEDFYNSKKEKIKLYLINCSGRIIQKEDYSKLFNIKNTELINGENIQNTELEYDSSKLINIGDDLNHLLYLKEKLKFNLYYNSVIKSNEKVIILIFGKDYKRILQNI